MAVVQLAPLTAELVWVVDWAGVRFGVVRDEPTGPSSVEWFTERWHAQFPTDQGCTGAQLLRGDASIAADRSRGVAYAALLQGSGFRVERLALDFEFGAEPQCVAFNPDTTDFPPGSADQTSVTFVSGSATEQLWVAWRAGRWPNNRQYLGKVALHDTRIQSTGFSWQQLADPTELDTDYSRCQVPEGAPERGRGRLLATASGAVYHAYTNMADDLQVGAEVRRRTYVERLTEPTFSLCLDDSIPGIVTDQNYFDLGDPDLAFDERSRSLFVAYPSQHDGDDARRVVLAAVPELAAGSIGSWSFQFVDDQPVVKDRGHINVVATTSTDSLERLGTGIVHVSWLEPATSDSSPPTLAYLVERRARGYSIRDGRLQPRSRSFAVSSSFLPNITSERVEILGAGSKRGIYEYQGMAHLPVSQDWMTVWSEPVDTSEPDPELFQTRYATWD